MIVNDPSRSNLFGRAYSKSFTRKIVLKVGIFLQAIDKANAAGGVWANPKWVLLPYAELAQWGRPWCCYRTPLGTRVRGSAPHKKLGLSLSLGAPSPEQGTGNREMGTSPVIRSVPNEDSTLARVALCLRGEQPLGRLAVGACYLA